MALTVDHNSPIPYYLQVMDVLRDQIVRGMWKPGEKIPGEQEMCEMFDVSRTVIRQALGELMHEGLIVRKKGRGTYVGKPKIREGLVQKLAGFYQDMVDQGYHPVTKVLKQQAVPASRSVAEHLQIEPDTQVIEIERLRSVQDEPIALTTTYIPYHLCPKLLSDDLEDCSLYAVLEESYHLTIVRGHRTVEAVLANDRNASLLGVSQGSPLILLNSVGYLEDDTPVEYFYAWHRGDRSRFEVELLRVRDLQDTGIGLIDPLSRREE